MDLMEAERDMVKKRLRAKGWMRNV
jgi:hypothetical protein